MRIDRGWTMLLAVLLAIPPAALTATGEGGGDVVTDDDLAITGGGTLQVVRDLGTVSKLNGYASDLRSMNTQAPIASFKEGPVDILSETGHFDPALPMGITPMYTSMAPARGSDAEGEQSFYDYPNGSKLSTPMDSVAGSLYFDDAGAASDWVDWYKFDLADIDPSAGAPNGVHNITFTINDITDDLGGYDGLYEYALTPINETTSRLSDDYADLIDVIFLYQDPWLGRTYIGGWSFFFDDKDDLDGWTWDSNWTVDHCTPVPSTGAQDPDGFANGLTEVGWYYIGIAINWYANNDAPDRTSFGLRYDFGIDTSRRQNTDDGANDWEVAGPIVSGSDHIAFSRYNNVDWYKVEGQDPAKLWNMTINVTRTGAAAPRSNFPVINDPWLHTFIFWNDAGPDETWDTEDDMIMYYWFILSAFLEGTLGNALLISSAAQGIQPPPIPNDWTQTDKREVYIGLYSEPRTYVLTQTGALDYFIYPNWFAWSEYRITYDIIEESVNRAPSIPLLQYRSDWVLDPKGGNYDSEFTFDVIYQDPDNDPPLGIFLRFDPDTPTQKEFTLTDKAVDPNDLTYDNGKAYRLTLTGKDITKGTKDIGVHAVDDIPVWSLRKPLPSLVKYLNDTLEVWDDDPVGTDPLWPGIPQMMEDDPEISVPLLQYEGYGPFTDEESGISSVVIWDPSTNDWGADLEGFIARYEIVSSTSTVRKILPHENVHGSEELTLRAYDEHSWVNLTTSAVVDSVNDIPQVMEIKKGSQTYSVLKRNERSFEADMADEWTVLEDHPLTFTIIADDPDLEETSGDFSFEYLDYKSDDWKVAPIITSEGLVTLVPTNDDLRNEEMFFSVSDGADAVELLVTVKVNNVNDPPKISLLTVPTSYEQYDRIELDPSHTDPDPGDTITYAVNMESSFGDDYPSVEDQLPDLVLDDLMWFIDSKTGRFWFQLDDQRIWGKGPDRDKVVKIVIAIKVLDSGGASDIASIEVTLNDVNDPPQAPLMIQSSRYEDDTNLATEYTIEKYRVHLWVDPAVDPDGDTLEYKWDLGDGTQLIGQHINHTYTSGGTWNVKMTVDDGTDQSDILQGQVTTVDVEIPGPPRPEDPKFPVGIVIGAVFLVLAVLIGVAIFLLLRKRKGPEEAEEGRSFPQRRSEDAHRSRSSHAQCPTCGTEVDQSWFICPGCHNSLQ